MDKSSLVVSGDYNLTSLSTEDGSINWASEIDGISGLLNQEVLYSSTQNWIISTHFEDVLVWNSITGELQYHLGEKQGIVVHELGYPALTNNGYAFIGDTVNAYVLDWSGEVKFSINIEPWVSRSIAFQNETLFLGSRDNIHGGLTLGNITAFDSETGDSLWQYNTQNGGFSYTSDLVIENNMIYGGTIGNSPNSELVALDAATGVVIWKQTDYVWAQNLSLGSQHVYVNTGGSLVAFDKGSGSFQWRVEWSSFDNYKPVYLEGYVYRIGTSELLIIDDATGEVVHREPVPDGNGYFWNVSAGTDKIFVQTNVAVIAYEPWHLRGD
jgi:outer membrane protein assembly factor BamB